MSILKSLLVFLAITSYLLSSCTKADRYPYEYWSERVQEKYQEISTRVQSVPCNDIDEFEIVNRNGYYLVHPSVQDKFDLLMEELDALQIEAGKAASREGIMATSFVEPNPPLRKECKEGNPKLVYAQELSLEEIDLEIPLRYEEIKNFYTDTPCTDPANWTSSFLRIGCCHEGIAIHKTIQSGEFREKIHIFNRLQEVKLALEKTSCIGSECARLAKPVQCVDGKPIV